MVNTVNVHAQETAERILRLYETEMDLNSEKLDVLSVFLSTCCEIANVYPDVFRKRLPRWEEYKKYPELKPNAQHMIDIVEKKSNGNVSDNVEQITVAQSASREDSNVTIGEVFKSQNSDPSMKQNSNPPQVCITCSSDKESMMKQLQRDLLTAGKFAEQNCNRHSRGGRE